MKRETKLSKQVKTKVSNKKPAEKKEYDGDFGQVISTGSTLLDLAISGGRVRGGGLPGGILVEIFGPASSGKTVLLCEIAGMVQRAGGKVMFRDPEARLNKQFAQMFDLEVGKIDYDTPNTVPEVFEPIRKWEPEGKAAVHGIFADSLAALSTEWEMEGKDEYGMRRAKQFSEQCRLTCRTLTKKNFLMVCSNQVRQNLDAGMFGQKYKSPGGEAIGFYASLRLRIIGSKKIQQKEKVVGKEIKRSIGVETQIEVFKSSIWKPYRTAPLTILFDYGIDDIRDCLQYLKTYTKNSIYQIGEHKLSQSMEDSILMVEEDGLEDKLKEETINLWEEIENKFSSERKNKKR